MKLSKRAVLNPKQPSKDSKISQSQTRFLPGLTSSLTGADYLVVVGRRGSGGGSEQDENDSVQITTIQ